MKNKEEWIYNIILFSLSILLALLIVLAGIAVILEFNHRYRVL